MQIGNLGSRIIFLVSDRNIFTFNNFNQKVTGTWTKHEIIGSKPKTEFTGAGLRQITFDIVVDAMYGARPYYVLESMEVAVETGEVNFLVIGGKQIGKHKWKITSLSEKWDVVMTKGELARATLSMTLEEYL